MSSTSSGIYVVASGRKMSGNLTISEILQLSSWSIHSTVYHLRMSCMSTQFIKYSNYSNSGIYMRLFLLKSLLLKLQCNYLIRLKLTNSCRMDL